MPSDKGFRQHYTSLGVEVFGNETPMAVMWEGLTVKKARLLKQIPA